MQFLSLIAAFGIVFVAIFVLIVEIYFVFVGHWKGAPFVKSKKEKIVTMLEFAKITAGETVYDLGSGDGELVIEAARRGARAIGIEINPFLVFYSRYRARRLGLPNAVFLKKDFRKQNLKNANVVFLYLWPSTLEKLKEKLFSELKPDTRIISNGFPISGWRAILEKDGVYLYQI